MNDDVRNIFIELISRHGAELAREYKRLKGFLLDRCPEARREVAVLVLAAEVGIAKELYQDNGTTSPGLLLPRLIVRLYDDYGIDRKLAAWVVESWAEALKEARASARPKEDLAPFDSTADSVSKQTFTINGVSFNMVRIPAGEFMMGSPPDEPGRFACETQHLVRITRDYWLGETQVTQALWEVVMGDNPSRFRDGGKYPVENVSWDDCQGFIKELNRIDSGGGFQLPTEAEWEYACRAGATTPFHTGRCLGTHEANYKGEYPLEGCPKGEDRGRTTRVASFAPNAWGLYDMHGNVWEWCQDRYNDYPTGSVVDPEGPSSGSLRVLRGGSWSGTADSCRAARRNRFNPAFRAAYGGFRLVCLPEGNNPSKYTKLRLFGVELPDDATQEQGWIMTRDNRTGLLWEIKNSDNKDVRYGWHEAQEVFIKKLNREHFGGFSDWRLPTVDELKSIVDKNHHNPAINTKYFPNTVSSAYWSGTTAANYTGYAWRVNFNYGLVGYGNKSNSYYVRAVRAGQ